jgi:hypothetical protein
MNPPTNDEAPTNNAAGRGRRGDHRRLVIADWGGTAELIVLPAGQPVRRGTEFSHHGSRWVVTGEHRDSRILVAEPVHH